MRLKILNRSCQEIGCHACCALPTLAVLNKPAGKDCDYLNRDQNKCEIYGPSRPDECQNFRCEWLDNTQWPVELDPVTTGCVFHTRQVTDTEEMMVFVPGDEIDLKLIKPMYAELAAWWALGERSISLLANREVASLAFATNVFKSGHAVSSEAPAIMYLSKRDPISEAVLRPCVTVELVRKYDGDLQAIRVKMMQEKGA